MSESNPVILLVEDDQDHAELFTANLKLTCYANAPVHYRTRFAEALDFLQGQHADVVLLDLSLPDSTISDTLSRLGQLTGFCPVIVSSSLDDKNIILDVINRGADDCLPKLEINDVLLERAIRFALDRWRLRSELAASDTQLRLINAKLQSTNEFLESKVEERTQALRNSLDKLQAAASAGIVGVWDWDIPNDHLVWDSVMYTLYGTREKDWGCAYQAWAKTIHPEDKTYAEGEIQAALRGEREYAPEFRIIWSDGSVHFIKAAARTTFDADGKPLRMIGVNYDQTAQKNIEQALNEERAHLTTLIETIPDLVWLKNVDGIYLSCNRRFEKFFGAPVEQIIGKTDYDFLDKELANLFRENDRKVIEARGQSINEEQFTFAEDGHIEILETIKTPMVDSEGKLIGVLGIGHDITQRKQMQDELAASETRLAAILATTGECVKLVARDGTVVSINRAGLELIEADTPDAVINHCIYEVIAPEHRQAFQEFTESICDGGAGGHLQFQIIGLKGTRRWMETHAVPFAPPEGGERLKLAFLVDISERKIAESKLSLAASVFSHAREGILITDQNATIVDVNETFTQITGYSREEAIGQNPRILQSGRHSKDFYSTLWDSLIEKGHWCGEFWNRRKDGEVFAELVTISAVYDAIGQVSNYVGLFNDITPMKMHQAELEHIAHFDGLTSLPNRLLLSDRLNQALIHSQRRELSLAVLYLDLDGFKAVNDQYGHEVGDQLLIAVSTRMKDSLREGDTLARMGGDEFVAVLVDLEQTTDYEPILFRLLKAASAPVQIDEVILTVSASIGVTLSPRNGIEPDQLIRQADQAMYQAKQSGKNRHHLFDLDFDQQIKIQLNTLESISKALSQNEFVLYYQPKIVINTGQVVGVEALIRWNHPEQGILLPAAFLPLIHDHPLSIELGEWVINTALKQLEIWHEAGLDIPVSVNIGARQLLQGNFVNRLTDILSAHPGIMPSYLELEILETSALKDLNLSTDVMHACHKLGVRFALDDFGTGYSSLTYLRFLPADVIKIDQTFVRDMLNDQEDHHIVQAVVELARTFRRSVIAEGVETIEHGNALIRLGCEYAQGYAIAKPMPGNEFQSWVSSWKPEASWLAI
jgi:diguanylate cyclase (GGDEF)-like protein/PAS domain S-box-containing protein